MFYKISWAYPTSTHADKLGHSLTGCYTVEKTNEDFSKYILIAGFPDKKDAQTFADTLHLTKSKYSL